MEVNTIEDKEIVELYLQRDESAIEQVQLKYGQRLKKIAYEITEDFQAAEECENDTYLKTWESIPPHTPYDYLYPFLVHINRNVALNYCRYRNSKKRKTTMMELSTELEQILPGINDIEEWIDDIALKEILNSFLGSLSEEKRNIFIRRYWYLDSVEQIARGYGVSKSKVKIVLFRCRQQLKIQFEKEGYTV